MVSRRRFLKVGAAGVVLVALGYGLRGLSGSAPQSSPYTSTVEIPSFTSLSDLINTVSVGQGGDFAYTLTDSDKTDPVSGRTAHDFSFVNDRMTQIIIDGNRGEISQNVDLSRVDVSRGAIALLRYQSQNVPKSDIYGRLAVYQKDSNGFLNFGLPFYLENLTKAMNPQFSKRIKYNVRDQFGTSIIFSRTVEA